MHILFVLEFFKPHVGGSETLFDNVISWLTEKNHTVTIVTSRYTSDLPAYETIFYGTQPVEIYRVGHNRYDFMWFGFWKVLRCLREYQIDLIQTATFNAAVVCGFVKRFRKIPIILHVHEVYVQLRYTFFWWKWFFYKLVEWLIFQFTFDAYTCSSLYTKNSLRLLFGIPDRKLVTTYCGIDYAMRDKKTVDSATPQRLREQYACTDRVVWLYFGRPGVAKWLTDYITSLPHIRKHIPTYTAFLIVPKTEKSSTWIIKSTVSNDEVTTLIQNLGVEDMVIWIDSVRYAELKQYIIMADLVVLPTMAEWFGLAIAEVCALEKPLVTTNVWSVPEVVGGEIALVEPWNPEDIARGVIELVSGKSTHLPLKKFYWKDCVEKFLAVYEKIR